MKSIFPSGIAVWACLSGALSSCGFSDAEQTAYAAKRRATLLEMYPPGKTTRADVRKRFGIDPADSGIRPSGGWERRDDWWVRTYTTNAEQRIGKRIASFDRYFGGDGFFSLCHCWFYFDSQNRVMDAEWQWSSD